MILIMTPKEKAKELFNRFEYKVMSDADGTAHKGKQKDCVDIVCNEVLKLANLMDGGFSFEKEIQYWKEVKREVDLL